MINVTGKYHGLNDQSLKMPCPKCGNNVSVKFSDIKGNKTVCCNHCSLKINIEDKDKSFDNLDKKLGKMFKKILK